MDACYEQVVFAEFVEPGIALAGVVPLFDQFGPLAVLVRGRGQSHISPPPSLPGSQGALL